MTGWNRPRHQNHRRIIEGDLGEQVFALWSDGRDTLDIARVLSIPESDIANNLPKILERHRHEERWSAATA